MAFGIKYPVIAELDGGDFYRENVVKKYISEICNPPSPRSKDCKD